MKEIQLTQGQVALIDDEDYERVSKYKWYADKQQHKNYTTDYYVHRKIRTSFGRTTESLHRFILSLTPNDFATVDHIDGNPLNNQKSNLRLATRSQQSMNMCGLGGHLKGAYPTPKCRKKWKSVIKQVLLGYYDTEIEAHEAYVKAAKEYFGEFARAN